MHQKNITCSISLVLFLLRSKHQIEHNMKIKTRWLGVILLFLPLLYGCQEESIPDEGAEISLNFLSAEISYTALPLIGTQWKLLGFVDGRKNRITLTTPFRDKIYLPL